MSSKAVTIVAIVLIALGAFGLARGRFSYTEEKHEAEIGGIELSVKDKETVAVPQWLSIGAIALGAILLLMSVEFAVKRDLATAKRLFFGSIIYLPILWAILVFDHRAR